MIASLGTHGGFIVASYALGFVVVAGLVLRAIVEHRVQTKRLAALEERGMRRRSEPGR